MGVKAEPATPKRRKPERAEETEPEKASEDETEKPVAMSSKPGKAATAKAKPEKADLPPPPKAAWSDMAYQLKKLKNSGKGGEMLKAWDEAQAKGQLAKRQFYYNVFLLDANASKKEIHKSSLERLTDESTKLKGWVTKWEVGKLHGADPAMPNFEALCDAACEGLKSRDHEVEAWAKLGIQQYYLEKRMMDKEKHSNESLTQAKQQVEVEEQEDFERVERALMADPTTNQVVLGKKNKPVKALELDKKPEPEKADEAWKKCVEDFSKPVKALSAAKDKLVLLKKSLEKAAPSSQLTATLEELNSLELKMEEKKLHWMDARSALPAQAPDDFSQQMAKVKADKQACEDDLKGLNKAICPHKMWAKNAGLI